MTRMNDRSQEKRVPCPLRSAAVSRPDAPAIIGSAGTITYAELDRRVTSAAAKLEDLGLEDGARVALYLPKSADYVLLLFALIRARRVACPLSTRPPTASIAPLLRKAGCRVLISDDESIDLPDATRLRPDELLEGPADGGPFSEPPRISLDRPVTVVFTSGSTEAPKAALHTFGNHYLSARGSNVNIPLAPGDRWLHSLPLYHVGGLSILFRCLLAGAAVALPQPEVTLGEAIARSAATHVSLVSTQLLRLLREERFDASNLKAILLGGGPMPASLLDEAVRRGHITRKDATALTQSIVATGRSQADGFRAGLEHLLGRGTSRAAQSGDAVLREVDRARRAVGVGPAFPITRYDDLSAAQVQKRLADLTPPELRKVRDYEKRNQGRKSVLDAVERKLKQNA